MAYIYCTNSLEDKIDIMCNSKSLKGTGIYIRADDSYKEREIRGPNLSEMENVNESNGNSKL